MYLFYEDNAILISSYPFYSLSSSSFVIIIIVNKVKLKQHRYQTAKINLHIILFFKNMKGIRKQAIFKKEEESSSSIKVEQNDIFVESDDSPDNSESDGCQEKKAVKIKDEDSELQSKSLDKDALEWASKLGLQKPIRKGKRGRNRRISNGLNEQDFQKTNTVSSLVIENYKQMAIEKAKIYYQHKSQQKKIIYEMNRKIKERLRRKRKGDEAEEESEPEQFGDIAPGPAFCWFYFKMSPGCCRLHCKICQRKYFIHRVSSSKLSDHIRSFHPQLDDIEFLFQQEKAKYAEKKEIKAKTNSLKQPFPQQSQKASRSRSRKIDKEQHLKKQGIKIQEAIHQGRQYVSIESCTPSRQNRRSWAWRHFLYNQQVKEAKCKYCPATYNLKDGSTTGMLKHAKNEHPKYVYNSSYEGSENEDGIVPSETRKRKYKKRRSARELVDAENEQKQKINEWLQKQDKQSGNIAKYDFPKLMSYKARKRRTKKQMEMDNSSDKRKTNGEIGYTRQKVDESLVKELIFNFPMDLNRVAMKRDLRQHFQKVVNPAQLFKILQNNHWLYQNESLKAINALLKNHNLITFLDFQEKPLNKIHQEKNFENQGELTLKNKDMRRARKKPSYLLIYSYFMLQQFMLYGDTFCIFENNLQASNQQSQKLIKSILYFTGQDKAGNVVIFGLALIFVASITSYKECIQQYLNKAGKSPKGQVICGSNDLHNAYEEYRVSRNYPIAIYIHYSILLLSLPALIQEFLIKWIPKIQGKKKEKIKQLPFLGFILNGQYFSLMRCIMSNQKSQGNNILSQHIFKLFQYESEYRQSIKQGFKKSEKQFYLFRVDSYSFKHEEILEKVFDSNPELVELKRSLAPNIFAKFMMSYFYAISRHQIVDRFQNKCVVRKNCSLQQARKVYNEVIYNIQLQFWECQCSMLKTTGLPCPHLILILREHQGSFIYYINHRWLLDIQNQQIHAGNKRDDQLERQTIQMYSKFGYFKRDTEFTESQFIRMFFM